MVDPTTGEPFQMYCAVDIVQLQPPNGEYGFLGCSDH
jgi:hypothetical protein